MKNKIWEQYLGVAGFSLLLVYNIRIQCLPLVCCSWPFKWLSFLTRRFSLFPWTFWRISFSLWSQCITEDDISRWCSCILSSTWISAIQHTTDNSKADPQLKLSTVSLLLVSFSSFLDCFIFPLTLTCDVKITEKKCFATVPTFVYVWSVLAT